MLSVPGEVPGFNVAALETLPETVPVPLSVPPESVTVLPPATDRAPFTVVVPDPLCV